MMSKLKVTVVIPVYNGEKHLQANFDSMLNQTMNPEQFEVLYVNNCSTDNTRALIEELATRTPSVKLINKAVNSGGPYQSMNDAMDAAQGKYIHFLDSDDFLSNDALEHLFEAAEQYHSDIIFGRYIGVNGRPVPNQVFKKGNLEKASIYTEKLFYSLAPHKMFLTSFLRKQGFKFHTTSRAGNEDQLFTLQCYLAAETITVLADFDHYYVVARGDENMTSTVYPPELYFTIPNLIERFIENYVSNATERQKIKSLYANRFLTTERLRKYLLDPAFPAAQKKAWLAEGKKFLHASLGKDGIQMLDAGMQEFAKAVLTDDMDKINKLAIEKQQASEEKLRTQRKPMVTARQNTLTTYIRPTEKSNKAASIPDPQKPFRIYDSIKGWFEVRLPSNDGGTHAVFIKSADVRYTLSFIITASVQRLKKMIA